MAATRRPTVKKKKKSRRTMKWGSLNSKAAARALLHIKNLQVMTKRRPLTAENKHRKKLNTRARQHQEIWMECPKAQVEYPGLAYLYCLTRLKVTRKLDKLHESMGVLDIAYTIYNDSGHKVFIAAKKRHFRKFVVKIFNRYGNEVVQISRQQSWFLSTALVWGPPDHFVGSIEEHLWNHYSVKSRDGLVTHEIDSSGIFSVDYCVTASGKNVGVVLETKGTDFTVTFPEDFPINEKVMMLSACFLISCLKC